LRTLIARGLIFQLFRRAVVAPDPVAIVLSRTLLTREFTWRSQLLQPVPADSRVLLARLRSARSCVSAGKG